MIFVVFRFSSFFCLLDLRLFFTHVQYVWKCMYVTTYVKDNNTNKSKVCSMKFCTMHRYGLLRVHTHQFIHYIDDDAMRRRNELNITNFWKR